MTSIQHRAGLGARAGRLIGRVGNEAFYLDRCFRSGMLGLEPPHRFARIAKVFRDYGTLGGLVAIAAIRHPDQLAVVDEHGELTYRELDDRVNAIANAWIKQGLKAGEGVAIMTRNHAGFLEAMFAAAKCGARVILMNTGFSGPQVREVAAREGADCSSTTRSSSRWSPALNSHSDASAPGSTAVKTMTTRLKR